MAKQYLHEHKDFPSLINILAEQKGIPPVLIEKDYWIMQVLHGLKNQGFDFELKGGTSLSKGYGIINRFSEDIDIQINPPAELKVETRSNKTKPVHVQSRKDYYNWLAGNIKIDGIISIERDESFDDETSYRSGGIRLHYKSYTANMDGVKEGILLEVGFDDVTPNQALTISSWAYEYSKGLPGLDIIDNRAVEIKCYDYRYTFVEKLQTVVRKFRVERETGVINPNFLRQYYDLYELLGRKDVVDFLGSDEYLQHKNRRFSQKDLAIPLNEFEGFLFTEKTLLESFAARYQKTKALYYQGQPAFEEILARIKMHIDAL